jgi:hypothetical protein
MRDLRSRSSKSRVSIQASGNSRRRLSSAVCGRQFDYAICSLFTHHFADQQVIKVLRELERVARRRLFVIDLHRHPIAYFFYTTVGRLFLHNRLLREDGALSILRSFKPDELVQLAGIAGLNGVKVERYFPYRLVLSAAPVAEVTIRGDLALVAKTMKTQAVA